MGAIFGIVSLKTNVPSSVTYKRLKMMSSCMEHRGPNREAFYLDNGIGLGVRLMEAFDIPNQPIEDGEKSLVSVCDGRIDNLSELRRNLLNAKTEYCSDGKILFDLWSSYGSAFLNKLKGMFTLALYNKNRNQVLIATAKFATKPIYYLVERDKLIFASEIKALLVPGIRCEVDYRAIVDFFIIGFPMNGKTFFKGVNRLLPGHMLLVENGKLRKLKYHGFDFAEKTTVLCEYEAQKQLKTLLSKSVEKSLVADVPVGMALSGGLDSSLITAIASKILMTKGKKLMTFSSIFPGYDCDESKYARIVAEAVGTEHHEVTHGPEDFVETFSQLIMSAEEPYEQIMTHGFALSKQASKHVEILLSGTGCGMLFGGGHGSTHAYIEECLIERRDLRNCLIPALKDIMKGLLNRDFSSLFSFLRLIFPSLASRFLAAVVCRKDESIKKHLLAKKVYNEVEGYYPSLFRLDIGKDLKPFAKATYSDLMEWGSTLVATADKLNMSCSMWAVHPFLEQDLVEYAFSLHQSQKIRNFQKKYIVKKVAEQLIPAEIVWRKKMPFVLPSAVWFRNELKEFMISMLTDSRTKNRQLLNQDFVEKRLLEHVEGKRNWGDFLGRLLSFEVWCRKFIDAQGKETIPKVVEASESLHKS